MTHRLPTLTFLSFLLAIYLIAFVSPGFSSTLDVESKVPMGISYKKCKAGFEIGIYSKSCGTRFPGLSLRYICNSLDRIWNLNVLKSLKSWSLDPNCHQLLAKQLKKSSYLNENL